MSIAYKIIKAIIGALFPNTCVSCGSIIEEGEHLCCYCYDMISRPDPLKRCRRCGQVRKHCECNKRVFLYDGCIAPFYNEGVAQTAMYKYKFRRRKSNYRFFAEQMAISIRNEYSDICFDGIAYVPLSKRKILLRGFDQCYILAKEISKILNIPFLDGALECISSNKTQHDMSYKERFKNVEGLYRCPVKNTDKIILLLDDIKTTGATLQECTKQLLLSGASKVYCVTGLITKNKKEG